MVYYCMKGKECFNKLLLVLINKVRADPKEKKPVWRGPDIKQNVYT